VIGGAGVHTGKIRVFKEQVEQFNLDDEGIRLILDKMAYKACVTRGDSYFHSSSIEYCYLEKACVCWQGLNIVTLALSSSTPTRLQSKRS